ncbi:hypothetical protein KSF78_0002899 [Schistosoma japonicum]|uniref:MICOS complex subunit n=1 Tax=Schistosoma japonicum TaxID=6182 RepID=C1LN45_SCHJA|nr:hypothetical protein KSF78_0002899 [Schistosoma japonicum]CAX70944.1 hypothetical protein [Schistosoma japonicum]CAX76117.1 hypothetical protein [Schistosoma japonicum]CAX76118.1 hypothetical protein [Schistosoma japonicum]CAX76119.1 hypothetical protein [Schistosoma japonicum]
MKELPIYSEYLDNATYILEKKNVTAIEGLLVQLVHPLRIEIQELFAQSKRHLVKYQSNFNKTSSYLVRIIRDEPVIFARIGFIASCSLGGWILGYKGHSIRKLLYASVGGCTATVVCFPNSSLSSMKYACNIGKEKFTEITRKFSN